MTVICGATRFDKICFDADADVLYLAVDGSRPASWLESPEGHVLRYDTAGHLIGVTVLDVRDHLDDGRITVTVPERVRLELPDLALT